MRRRRAEKRRILPDPKFKNLTVSKFINVMMLDGKKSTAERIVYDALDDVVKKVKKENGVQILLKALANSRPLLKLKSRRVGGATYQIPCEVDEEKGIAMAMMWIRDTARGRSGKSMKERLCDEIADAYNGQGAAIKKRDEVHRMAEANRAFSHYRW